MKKLTNELKKWEKKEKKNLHFSLTIFLIAEDARIEERRLFFSSESSE